MSFLEMKLGKWWKRAQKLKAWVSWIGYPLYKIFKVWSKNKFHKQRHGYKIGDNRRETVSLYLKRKGRFLYCDIVNSEQG
jgi:hypothetical protein